MLPPSGAHHHYQGAHDAYQGAQAGYEGYSEAYTDYGSGYTSGYYDSGNSQAYSRGYDGQYNDHESRYNSGYNSGNAGYPVNHDPHAYRYSEASFSEGHYNDRSINASARYGHGSEARYGGYNEGYRDHEPGYSSAYKYDDSRYRGNYSSDNSSRQNNSGYTSAPTAKPYQPTRPPTPPPAAPSTSYLAASLAPRPVAPDDRKLMIFDLNGTLLLRSSRNFPGPRKIYLRPYARALAAYVAHPRVQEWLDVMVWSSAQAHNVREMVECVFGVGEGQGGEGRVLRAVWARDTLGLAKEEYYQKTQTTKDLAKPWVWFAAGGATHPTTATAATEVAPSTEHQEKAKTFPAPVRDTGAYSPSRPPYEYYAYDAKTAAETDGGGDASSTADRPQQPSAAAETSDPGAAASYSTKATPVPTTAAATPPPPSSISVSVPSDVDSAVDVVPATKDDAGIRGPYAHGAHSTLLVDDSPLKARLQPWNHLCVGEYAVAERRKDLDALRACQLGKAGADGGVENEGAKSGQADVVVTGGIAVDVDEGRNGVVDAHGDAPRDVAAPPKKKQNKRRRGLVDELAGLADEARADVVVTDVGDGDEAGDDEAPGQELAESRARGNPKKPPNRRALRKMRQMEENPSRKRLKKLRRRARKAGVQDGDEEGSEEREKEDQMEEASASSSPSNGALSPPLSPNGDAAGKRKREGGEDDDGGLSPSRKRVRDFGQEVAADNEGKPPPDPQFVSAPVTTTKNKSRSRRQKRKRAALEGVDASGPSADNTSPGAHSPVRGPDADPLPPPDARLSDENADKAEDVDKADDGSEPYDPTLLAVIGVLAHVRNVGNVAAWVRAGGLATLDDATVAGVEKLESGDEREAEDMLPDAGAHTDGRQVDGGKGVEAETADMDMDIGANRASSPAPLPPPSSAQAPPSPSLHPPDTDEPPPPAAEWFASPRILRAWAARGRVALAELGIEAAAGVE
ncbi:hypothetical protein C8J57DRAFT_1705186 [Mycena rebaudengoi]|nr:hypothetical protein C8J57DRAFT_1705186 [Mycena rebaudengoi]